MSDKDQKEAGNTSPGDEAGPSDETEEKRRKARRRMLTAAGIVTSDSLMEWHRPVIEHVMAPAHAGLTETPSPTISPTISPTQSPTAEPTTLG